MTTEQEVLEPLDLRLFRLVHKPDTSYVFSPLSIEMALQIANTIETDIMGWDYALFKFLGGSHSYHPEAREKVVQLTNRRNADIGIHNSIWTSKDLRNNFQREFLDPDIRQDVTVENINSWINEKTKGIIPRLVDTADPEQVRVLNAIYFKSQWSRPFTSVEDKVFHAPGGDKMVPTMFRHCSFGYYMDRDVINVKMDYDQGYKPLSLLVSMPLRASLGDYLQNNLQHEDYNAWKYTGMKLNIPKFSLDTKLDVGELLQEAGLESERNCTSVAKIDVDENGTVAAAVTDDIIACCGMASPPPIDVNINEPFLYRLVDQLTGVTLFAGAYVG